MLWHDVEVDLDGATPDVAAALRYLVTGAAHDFPPLATMRYAVTSGAPGHQVWEEGDELATVDDPTDVLDLVYRRVHQRAFELASLRGWVRLHAAVVDLVDGPGNEGAGRADGAMAGPRVLLVAPSGTGKTTLACRLLLDGQAVAGDESALVRDGLALPVARRFHLKPGLEAAVADLAPLTAHLPGLPDGSVRAFDPSEAGFGWTIGVRQVDHVVLLERSPGAGGLEPASAVEAMPEVVDQSFPHQEDTGALLAQVAAVLRDARCWRLRVDTPAGASILVRGLLSD
jgi:hypothetical protein